MRRCLASPLRRAAAAFALVLGLAAVAASQAPAPRLPPAGGAGTGGLWISDAPLDDGRRLLVIVDSATRHAAVYHLDTASGGLTLASARDLTWDLSIDEFNAQEPRPAALRKMLQSAPPQAP
ncbi:MAG: hypothetical protein ACKON7_05220 [Planctomycetaceae bacterium]